MNNFTIIRANDSTSHIPVTATRNSTEKCLTKETAQQKVQTKIKIKRINEDMYFRNDAHTCNEENKRLGLDFSCQIGLCSKHGE